MMLALLMGTLAAASPPDGIVPYRDQVVAGGRTAVRERAVADGRRAAGAAGRSSGGRAVGGRASKIV